MRVSVIIPAYNAAAYLGTAIDSVLAQTYKDYEIIVVDDGSTDNTREVVKKYKPVCRYVHQANAGPSAARNCGIASSSGDLIALLDADDAWLPGKLEMQVRRLLEKPKIGILDTAYYLCDSKLQPIRYQPPINVAENAIEDMFSNFKTPLTSSVIIRKSHIEMIGGFDQSLRVLEDHQLCLRLMEVCAFDSRPEPFVFYRVHAGNTLNNGQVILDAHSQIRSAAISSYPVLAHRQSTAIQHVEAFAIKVMCLQHQWRDALTTVYRFSRSCKFRDASKVSLYLVLLLLPKSIMPFLRKMYWKWIPA